MRSFLLKWRKKETIYAKLSFGMLWVASPLTPSYLWAKIAFLRFRYLFNTWLIERCKGNHNNCNMQTIYDFLNIKTF